MDLKLLDDGSYRVQLTPLVDGSIYSTLPDTGHSLQGLDFHTCMKLFSVKAN